MIRSALLVEDNEAKLESIRGLLVRLMPDAEVQIAGSVRSAISSLRQRLPDLIVADMSLPTYDQRQRERGGSPRPFGGIEVFEFLDKLEVVRPVIVVTSYPAIVDGRHSLTLSELSHKLQAEFPRTYRGTVYFDSSFSAWEEELAALLRQDPLGGNLDD